MKITLKIFGPISEIIGSSQLTMKDMETTDQLVRHLKELHPGLAGIKFALAVDKKIVEENTTLADRSIVALLPPFSGG